MEIDTTVDNDIVLSKVFNAVLIRTSSGTFAICERDGGIYIMENGKKIYNSNDRFRLVEGKSPVDRLSPVNSLPDPEPMKEKVKCGMTCRYNEEGYCTDRCVIAAFNNGKQIGMNKKV